MIWSKFQSLRQAMIKNTKLIVFEKVQFILKSQQ